MPTMAGLTRKQAAVQMFITGELQGGRACPTHREIAAHFGYASPNAAARHLTALVKKGVLLAEQGKARALCLADKFPNLPRAEMAAIPLFGSIPAGFGEEREEEAESCMMVDIATLGFKPSRNTFALRVSGDSMIGKHICDGDIVILEHGPEPRSGEIVAALIDRKSTLKTFIRKGRNQYLRAENPKYPDLIASEELMIQGVFRALIRKA